MEGHSDVAGRSALTSRACEPQYPGRRPLNLDEFKPAVGDPRCPEHIDRKARREWHRISAELAKYGLISDHRAALTFYCVNWARHCEAENVILKAAAASAGTGLFVEDTRRLSRAIALARGVKQGDRALPSVPSRVRTSPASASRVMPSTPQLALFGEETDPDSAKWSFL